VGVEGGAVANKKDPVGRWPSRPSMGREAPWSCRWVGKQGQGGYSELLG
jgi:hypothetical protein